MSAMDDVFGAMPNRPNTPDFWKLSEIVLRLDGAMEAATTGDEKEEAFLGTASKHIDMPSLSYIATHRAMKALGVNTQAEVAMRFLEVARLASVYVDAFVTACEFMADKEAK